MTKSQARYSITIQTSNDYKQGLTIASVSIRLISLCKDDSNRSPWVNLYHYFHNDFKAGVCGTFDITTDDVGLPDIIGLRIDQTKGVGGWLCDFVIVRHETLGEVFFSVYDVVLSEIMVRRGDASLPQKDSNFFVKDIRRTELERNKHVYQWHTVPSKEELGWDLPRYIQVDTYKELPILLQANDLQLEDFLFHRKIAYYNTLVEAIKGKIVNNTMQKFEDFFNVFHLPYLSSEKPSFHEIWSTDEEFGRQMLDGVNPTALQLCRNLPEDFQKVESKLFDGRTKSTKLIKEKKLYCVNYRGRITGIKRNRSRAGDQLHCCESICLFRVREDKRLIPIAIQLEEGGHIFTPRDTDHDWLLAKMYFRNTDANLHEFHFHLLRTHIIMEPLAVAMFRSFARSHPIYKLLRPHLQTVSAINTLGRALLLEPTAPVNFALSMCAADVIKSAFREFAFEDLIIPELLEKNGTDDPDALPYFHYRDDAKDLWNVIGKFVSKMLKLYYNNDQDVTEDMELQEFIRSVAEDGIGWAGIYGTKGFPTRLKTFGELKQYITIIIFTSSVQHAASNFGQFEIYKFAPNAPGGMRLPPHKKGEGTMQRILNSLPDPIMASLQATISNTLSSFSSNEIYLGDYPMKLFTERKVLKIQEEFRNDLKKLSQKFKKRNDSLPFLPYIHLLPERIPNSIAV